MTLANSVFEGVNKRVKKMYSCGIKSFGNIEDDYEKDVKKLELKKVRKSFKEIKDRSK